MNILMLGAGAMGSLLGARLSRTSARIVLFSTNQKHIEAIGRNSLAVEELDGSVSRFTLESYHRAHDIPIKADLVIVMVKSYATRKAVSGVLQCCGDSTVFLTLQNGIGNWEQIAERVGEKSVLLGSTAQGATLVDAGVIRHGGNGPTYIGEPRQGVSRRVGNVVDLFNEAGIKTEPSGRMEQLIWEKLHVNVGINAITALTGIRNGFIPETEAAAALCRAAVVEAMDVAGGKGFSIPGDMVDRVLGIARATAINRSSMGQDVDRKKRTEIDAINGAIVRAGDELGIPVPVNRTLTLLIKTLEAHYLKAQ